MIGSVRISVAWLSVRFSVAISEVSSSSMSDISTGSSCSSGAISSVSSIKVDSVVLAPFADESMSWVCNIKVNFVGLSIKIR